MSMRSWALRALLVMAITAVVLFLTPQSKNINLQVDAVEYRAGDEAWEEPVQLHLYGGYRRQMSQMKSFTGGIKISSYPLSLEHSIPALSFEKGRAPLTYVTYREDGQIEEEYFVGYLFSDSRMERFAILFDPALFETPSREWNEGNLHLIAYPSGSREEAAALLMELAGEEGLPEGAAFR